MNRTPHRATRALRIRLLLWISASLAFGAPSASGETQDSTPAPSPQAADALRLIESDDPYQQQLGFLRLEALREPGTAEAIRPYLDSRDPAVRAYALRALAALEGPAAVPRLLRALQQDPHPAVRRAALLGLEPLRPHDPDILPAFITALRDRKPEVRMTAVDVVSRIDDPRANDAIRTRNERERDRDVQRALSLAMKRLGGP